MKYTEERLELIGTMITQVEYIAKEIEKLDKEFAWSEQACRTTKKVQVQPRKTIGDFLKLTEKGDK